MQGRREGAAIRQDHRSYGYPATRRKPRTIISEQGEPEQWSRGKTAVAIAVGTPILYALMWLAAAY